VKGDPTFWIIARASGLVAYALLTTTIVAGLVVKTRALAPRLKPAHATDLHRFLALLALGAVAIHGLALVVDTTIRVPVAGLVVPGLVPYRPFWVALGVLAADLTLAVYVSFALRRRIGVRNWRRLHWSTYAIFAAATVHGIASGSDTGRAPLLPFYALAAFAVVAAAVWRALDPTHRGGNDVPHRNRSLAL
jgi:methionine sulfoxide reductase heme-binding subunit